MANKQTGFEFGYNLIQGENVAQRTPLKTQEKTPLTLVIDHGMDTIDLDKYKDLLHWHPNHMWFPMEPGKNHHKLLAHLVNQLPKGSKVADIGTEIGSSAVSMSVNPGVTVITVDNNDQLPAISPEQKTIRDIKNIEIVKADALDVVPQIIDCRIILLDISPHDGAEERKFLDKLFEGFFKGILVLDDIHMNDQMQEFWNQIELKKIDATAYGHHSGTGIVIFDPKSLDVEMK